MGSRKMKMFYGALILVIAIFFYSLFKGVQLTGDNLTTIIIGIFIFTAVMAGANVGEHLTDVLKIKYQNGTKLPS